MERMTIDPFDLREPKRYDLVIDRLTQTLLVANPLPDNGTQHTLEMKSTDNTQPDDMGGTDHAAP